MKAGLLTEEIRIERATTDINEYGGVVHSWALVAVVRAERFEQSTTEYIRNFGASDEELVIFRARFVEGVTTAHRVLWRGLPFNIKQIAPIGRRVGVELRCVRMVD